MAVYNAYNKSLYLHERNFYDAEKNPLFQKCAQDREKSSVALNALRLLKKED